MFITLVPVQDYPPSVHTVGLASLGFLALLVRFMFRAAQTTSNSKSMDMCIDDGIYYSLDGINHGVAINLMMCQLW